MFVTGMYPDQPVLSCPRDDKSTGFHTKKVLFKVGFIQIFH